MAFNETIPYRLVKEINECHPECTPSLSYSENSIGKEIIYCSNNETLPICDILNEKVSENHKTKSKLSTLSKSSLSNPYLLNNNNNKNKLTNKNKDNIRFTGNKFLESPKINNLFFSVHKNDLKNINKTNTNINANINNKKNLTYNKKSGSVDERNINKKLNKTRNNVDIIKSSKQAQTTSKNISNVKNTTKNKKRLIKNNSTYEFGNYVKSHNPKYNELTTYKNQISQNPRKTEIRSNKKKMLINPKEIIDNYIKMTMNNKTQKKLHKNKSSNFMCDETLIDSRIFISDHDKKRKNFKIEQVLSASRNTMTKNSNINSNKNKTVSQSQSSKINYKNYNAINLKTIKNNKGRVLLKISHLEKIMKKNGLFNVLTFVDDKTLINILNIRSKKLRLLINKSISDAYFFTLRKNIKKFKEYFEIIKCILVFSKIKESLKIDIMMNIRFIDANKNISISNPKYFKIIYIYEYLKRNEEDEKNKLFDCYQFDLYNEKYNNDNIKNNIFKGIYLSQEISLFGLDKNDELINIQQILPFKVNDKGIFNFEIYSSSNYFIDPSNFKVKLKIVDLNQNIKEIQNNYIDNIRISEYENICKHWKKDRNDEYKKINNLQELKTYFEPYFKINDIFYDSFGLIIYKFHLTAEKCGTLINNKININIIIKESGDYIENEIKKNNLLFERDNMFEIRVGDSIIFYVIMKDCQS